MIPNSLPDKHLFFLFNHHNGGALLQIAILSPWYNNWWAYWGLGLLAITLIYYYHRYKVNQVKLQHDKEIARLSAEKELYESKLSFFTNVAHEFRTPLTMIINPVKELLSDGNQNPQALNHLHIIYRNTRRLLSLADQLLLFRKADTDNGQLKIVKLNIAGLCRDVLLCFNHQFNIKNIHLKFETDDPEVICYADREKIEIVLFNLISNALKFTPDGGEIGCYIEDTDNLINISVSDTGCGIDETVGSQLFNKFYQVQTPHTTNGGFGIGLYLVKAFVESHKGNITYQSIPGQGTTFTISLLKGKEHLGQNLIFEDVAESSVFLEEMMGSSNDNTFTTDTNVENPVTGDTLYQQKKSMLIVEDNAEIRQYLKQIFQLDFLILETDNGTDALTMAYKHMPSFVISDVTLPGISGVELCSRIKEDITLNHIPVILLTGSTSPENRLKAIEGGADDYMTKPFEKDMLVARVNGLLKSRNNLKEYFFNEITLKPGNHHVPPDFKEFLDKCIKIVERHLTDKDFCIKSLATEIGMSHSNLYKKIKTISGQSANEFMRFIRLRKAAEIFLTTDRTVAETAFMVGINDLAYFREKFCKLFGLNPSDYIKKFRRPFHETITRDAIKR